MLDFEAIETSDWLCKELINSTIEKRKTRELIDCIINVYINPRSLFSIKSKILSISAILLNSICIWDKA